jgi:hypothetical protein
MSSLLQALGGCSKLFFTSVEIEYVYMYTFTIFYFKLYVHFSLI